MNATTVRIDDYNCGPGAPLLVIAGPCVIENEELVQHVSRRLAEVAARDDLQIVFKASFDKANRTSLDSFRGPGRERGLEILDRARESSGLQIIPRSKSCVTCLWWPEAFTNNRRTLFAFARDRSGSTQMCRCRCRRTEIRPDSRRAN